MKDEVAIWESRFTCFSFKLFNFVFQYNETKVDDLIDGTISFRQDMHEMRYLDDLLNLLDGELERISRRNWPFVFGHSEHRAEEMNLVI